MLFFWWEVFSAFSLLQNTPYPPKKANTLSWLVYEVFCMASCSLYVATHVMLLFISCALFRCSCYPFHSCMCPTPFNPHGLCIAFCFAGNNQFLVPGMAIPSYPLNQCCHPQEAAVQLGNQACELQDFCFCCSACVSSIYYITLCSYSSVFKMSKLTDM